MTVSSNLPRKDYDGTGSTDTFPYDFTVSSSSDLRVIQRDADGVETDLVLDTDYTVELLTAASGNVILTAGNLASGYHLTILLDLEYTQPTSIRNQGEFYEEVHEQAIDRSVLLIKQLEEKVSRAILLPVTTEGASGEIEGLTPGYAIGINATGDGLMSVPNTGADQSADLANAANAGKGAGLIGFGDGLGYSANTVGKQLEDLIDADAVLTIKAYSAVCEGRLTLASATAITTTDQTAKTTVNWTPFRGNRVALYVSSAWVIRTFTEKSVAVPATTSTPFDIFVYDNAGTPALETVNWTNDTTRATALAYQDGVLVKNGDATRRYLGTSRTTAVSGQTEDSVAKRFLWNYYNRVPREMRVLESTDSWTSPGTTIQQANASTANQLAMVIGLDEDMVSAEVMTHGQSSVDGGFLYALIGLDSATTAATGCLMARGNASITGARFMSPGASWKGHVGIGYHFLAWLERGHSSGTNTWYGDNGNPTYQQSGIHGQIVA